MANPRKGLMTQNVMAQNMMQNAPPVRQSLLSRIGNTLGNVGTGIGNMLASASRPFAPADMNLTRQQQIGLLGSVLGDMTIGPQGQRRNDTQDYLNNIRQTNELARRRQAMNSPEIQGLLSNVTDPAMSALLREQVASGDVAGGMQNLFNYNQAERAKRSLIDAARLSGLDPATLQALEGMDAAGITEFLEDQRSTETAATIREQDLGIGIYDDFKDDIEPFMEISPFFETIRGATETPTAAGDLGLIFAYMKMLDPGSVVREGEFAVAANSGGIPDRIRAQLQAVQSGQRLSPSMRRDFAETALRELENRRKTYENSLNLAYARADSLGVNRDFVFPTGQTYDLTVGPDGKTPDLVFGTEEGPQDPTVWARTAVERNGNNALIIREEQEKYPNDPTTALAEASRRIGYPQTLTQSDADFIVNTVENALSVLEGGN